jgi:hypothetical protein
MVTIQVARSQNEGQGDEIGGLDDVARELNHLCCMLFEVNSTVILDSDA